MKPTDPHPRLAGHTWQRQIGLMVTIEATSEGLHSVDLEVDGSEWSVLVLVIPA